MRYVARDFMGSSKIDIVIDGITLIVGKGHVAKTSASRGLAALVTGDTLPYDGILKSEAAQLIRSGAPESVLYLETADSKIRIDYPTNVRKQDGDGVKASRIATGLESWVDIKKDADRAEAIAKTLKVDVTRADLEPELEKIGCTAAEIFTMLGELTALGCDGALTAIKERGAKKKGQWEQLTQKGWGSVQAARWEPSTWEMDSKDWTEEFLTEKIKEARRKYEDLLRFQAITELEEAELKQLFESIPALEKASDAANKAYHDAEKAVDKAIKALDAHQVDTEVNRSMPCPECQCALIHIQGKLEKYTGKGISPEALQKQLDEGRALSEKVLRAQQARDTAKQTVQDEAKKLNEALAAGERLKKATVVTEKPDTEGVKNELSLAERRLADWKRKIEADDLNAQIMRYVAVTKLLAPNGIKSQKLKKVMKDFNERLIRLSRAAGYQLCTITPDLRIQYGPEPLWKISKSERFACQVILQAAIAQLDGSEMLIVDGADVLDKDDRNALMRLLQDVALPALVTMTWSSDRDPVPDLAKAKLGRTYLLEQGTTSLLGEKQVA